MRVNTLRRRRLTRFRTVLLAAAALAVPLIGTPASAAISGGSAPTASRAVSPAGVFPPNKFFQWKNLNSGLCLHYDHTQRDSVWQIGCDGDDYYPSDEIEWYMHNYGGENYEIINADENKCLSVPLGAMNDGAPVFLDWCQGSQNQMFTLIPDGQGHYKIKNVDYGSGKCVAVGGSRTNEKAWVIQWTCSDNGAYLWTPVEAD
jgi:hypothetical protein